MDPAGFGKRIMLDRSHVLKWTRPDLEDKFLKLYDDFLQSKQELNTKTTECKRLRGQLIKLKPRHALDEVEVPAVEQLEKENLLLKDKIKTLTYQLKAVQPNRTIRSHISHKVASSRSSHRMQVPLPEVPHKSNQSSQLQYVVAENADLKDQIEKMQRKFEFEYQKLKEDIIGNQKVAVTENVEMIKLQKQMNDKASELVLCQLKLKKLEQEYEILKSTKDVALNELNQCLESLRQEKMASYDLERENLKLKTLSTIGQQEKRGTVIIDQDLENLKKENELLKQTNEVLKNNAFKMDHLIEYSTIEKNLQSKVTHLETIIKDEDTIRKEMQEKLNQEIKIRTKAEEITKQLESKLIKQNLELESMKTKLGRLTWGDEFKEEDLIEALALLRQQKQLNEQLPNDPTSIKEKVTRVNQKLQELEVAYAETCRELDKVRAMLVSQHQISKTYESEIENLKINLDSKEREILDKTKKHMKMLDERSLRIQKLESALRNIAYGSKSSTVLKTESKTTTQEVLLEPGQIMLYLKITKVTLTNEALTIMKSMKPDWFLTVEFYDFDVQFTPIVCKTELTMDYTFYYIITTSDLFVRYLQTGFITMEFQQVTGEKYKTLAVGRIDLKDLSMHKMEISGFVHLNAISPDDVGTKFGDVVFSVKFGSSLDESIKSYKARLKALGFINNISDQDSDSTNELHIYVHRCRGLKHLVANKAPCPYVTYRFLDFPDTETQIIKNCRDPEFEDHKVFPIKVTKEISLLKDYLLKFYVFDDLAVNEKDSLLGVVSVDMSPLADNHPIRGSFPIKDINNQEIGSLDLSINWKFAPFDHAVPENVVADEITKEEKPAEDIPTSTIIEEHRIEEFYEKLEDNVAKVETVDEEQETLKELPKPKPRLMSLRPT